MHWSKNLEEAKSQCISVVQLLQLFSPLINIIHWERKKKKPLTFSSLAKTCTNKWEMVNNGVATENNTAPSWELEISEQYSNSLKKKRHHYNNHEQFVTWKVAKRVNQWLIYLFYWQCIRSRPATFCFIQLCKATTKLWPGSCRWHPVTKVTEKSFYCLICEHRHMVYWLNRVTMSSSVQSKC